EDHPTTTNQLELSLEEIRRIARGMKGLLFLLPTGGEPFLREDLAEIIKIFYHESGVRNVGIPTNGSRPQECLRLVKDVLSNCPDLDLGIDVSIDGVGQLHDDIRHRPGLFDQATHTFRELRKLKSFYPKFHVNVETTVSAWNQDHLDELFAYLTGVLEADTIFPLLTRGNPRDPNSKKVDVEKYERYTQKLAAAIENQDIRGYDSFPFSDLINAKRVIRHQLIAQTLRENRYQIPCLAGHLGATLLPYGQLLPCEMRLDRVIGNLRDNGYHFRRLWFSQKADEIRNEITASRCFCTYECFQTLNLLFNIKMYPRLLKEWLAIRWAKRKARSKQENA
ncbi:MAG TPA: radical SAM protein, partial [Candidatus Bathyarchaeia archaeon]|nr:radical SAM protein [Candidatus Bathyarchaeia archaeon]